MRILQPGFTIIELVLVLAITGLVAAMTLVGISTGLQSQRYTDATTQTLDYFQGLYGAATDVSNDRSIGNTCNAAGIVVDNGGSGPGTSECLLLGYIVRSTDGKELAQQPVVALKDITDTAKDDLTVLQDSKLYAVQDTQTRSLEWNTVLTRPSSTNPAQFSMLVVRVPTSGVIRTFTTSSATTNLATMIAASHMTAVTFCLDPQGLVNLGTQRNGFTIDANAASSSNVHQLAGGVC